MNITRYNYEEFFLLYVDNELNAVQRRQVEEFLLRNPDLQAELDVLKHSVLRPDKNVVFNKGSLLKNIPEDSLNINETNYEEYFILYADDELNNKEKDSVEQFVYKHPQYQEEFELFQKVKLVPETTLVFPQKKLLYRTEEDEKVVVFVWWRIAAAAVILLFLGGFGWYMINKNNNDQGVAGTQAPNGSTQTPKQDIQPLPQSPVQSQETAATEPNLVPVKEKNITEERKQPVLVKQKSKKAAPVRLQPNDVDQEQVIGATDQNKNIKSSNINDPVNVTQERPKVNVEEVVVSNAVQSKPVIIAEVIGEANPDEDIIYVANASISSKNKLRGIFRKASRILEKATNIESSDKERSGIRIANFEIALK